VPKSLAVDLVLRGHSDARLRDVAWALCTAATQDDANTLYGLRTGPGIGALLSRVRLDESQDSQRFPRGQEFVSDGRVGKCATASAGQRSGPSGTQLSPASLTWAFAEAAGLFRRHPPPGPQSRPRVATQQGQGTALTALAPKVARAVYHMLKRHTAFARQRWLQRASGVERVSPRSHGPLSG
jgi:hypothetical protein